MEHSEEQKIVNKLAKRTNRIHIKDHDLGEWEDVQGSFRQHFHPQTVSQFSKKSGSGKSPVCLFTDLFCDQKKILCGLENGICKLLDLTAEFEDRIVVNHQNDRSHAQLSSARCSRSSPHIFFSSSTEGKIFQWDIRQDPRKSCQKFSPQEAGNKTKTKPILQFDVSCQDQLLCAGTEFVDDDSYLLFFDTRSSKVLGAYWESHSDDVTAVKFHPSQIHSLASGSTDGLLNVFNLLEPAEDDALLYSFNTNSSVDRVHWYCPTGEDPKIACVTHTNEIQVWNTNTGDPVVEIKRELMAEAMMRSNPEAVYITGCHNLLSGDVTRLSVVANSLSGGNTRLIQLNDDMKPVPLGIFMDQTAVVQTAQYVSAMDQWLTFDEHGTIKIWKSSAFESNKEKLGSKESKREERRSAKRYKPYNKD